MMKIDSGAGKGDKFRKVDKKKYDENWPFPKKRLNIWLRDRNGNLIDKEGVTK